MSAEDSVVEQLDPPGATTLPLEVISTGGNWARDALIDASADQVPPEVLYFSTLERHVEASFWPPIAITFPLLSVTSP